MSNLKLQELARQERNQYAREWRAKNKDKVRASNSRYWERKAMKKTVREGVTNDGQMH